MIKINGKDYREIDINFNTICDLSNMGVDVYQYNSHPFPILRAYFALCSGLDENTAGDELEAHIMGGGDLTELSGAFVKSLTESGFFKMMTAKAEKAAKERSNAKAE